ncbi:hypothetical protein [Chamaesiphon sp. OTE_8_metabat_110]|uniref:hypothetical protein n=1 Tax=Chamaesiphon sp. OTE_8_metabat_110 TaxID=2964696 RepID=UPI00286A9831|nr:hypothetical protein [Chamaesiphon sp. OTE_8_metabat_110]
MLKLTSLAIGLLSILTMAPRSEAMTANARPVSIDRPAANLQSQIILKIGDRGYSRGSNYRRRRELELQREREAARLRRQSLRRERRSYGEYRRSR